MSILETVEIDHSAPSVHSGYDHETNRKLDTLFLNWTFESNRADYRGFYDDEQNTRADAALNLYNAAKGEAALAQEIEAALAQEAWRSATADDYESTVQAASFYTQ